MAGDWFVMALMTLNAGAAIAYAYQGVWWKVLYWCAVVLLNLSLLKLT